MVRQTLCAYENESGWGSHLRQVGVGMEAGQGVNTLSKGQEEAGFGEQLPEPAHKPPSWTA